MAGPNGTVTARATAHIHLHSTAHRARELTTAHQYHLNNQATCTNLARLYVTSMPRGTVKANIKTTRRNHHSLTPRNCSYYQKNNEFAKGDKCIFQHANAPLQTKEPRQRSTSREKSETPFQTKLKTKLPGTIGEQGAKSWPQRQRTWQSETEQQNNNQ